MGGGNTPKTPVDDNEICPPPQMLRPCMGFSHLLICPILFRPLLATKKPLDDGTHDFDVYPFFFIYICINITKDLLKGLSYQFISPLKLSMDGEVVLKS